MQQQQDVLQLLSAVDAGWLLHFPAAQNKQLVSTPFSAYCPSIQFVQVGASLAENGMYCPLTHADIKKNTKEEQKKVQKKLIKYQKIKKI